MKSSSLTFKYRPVHFSESSCIYIIDERKKQKTSNQLLQEAKVIIVKEEYMILVLFSSFLSQQIAILTI